MSAAASSRRRVLSVLVRSVIGRGTSFASMSSRASATLRRRAMYLARGYTGRGKGYEDSGAGKGMCATQAAVEWRRRMRWAPSTSSLVHEQQRAISCAIKISVIICLFSMIHTETCATPAFSPITPAKPAEIEDLLTIGGSCDCDNHLQGSSTSITSFLSKSPPYGYTYTWILD